MILLDTHPLIWFILGNESLGRRAQEIVLNSLENDEAAVSPISFWEASMLAQKGRVAFGRAVEDWMDGILSNGIRLVALSPEIAVAAGQLPGGIHGDPADRLIIATARGLGCPLLTADRQILGYSAQGHVSAIDARL
jgi:PIN domain nuclease of toxin-antitoxin system